MFQDFSEAELQQIQIIAANLLAGRTAQGIQALRSLKDNVYAAIQPKQRISHGITWVVERLSAMFVQICSNEADLQKIALVLCDHLPADDRLLGTAVFLMAEYGLQQPGEVLDFFEKAANSPDWVSREFAACAGRKFIGPQRTVTLPWLKGLASSKQPNVRRFAAETLRPVTGNRWLNREPEALLEVLRLMFCETHPYPRTSVGNNLSDLARRQPELVYALVEELVASGDKNSYWIAYRACRNLVKKEPQRVMDLLRVDEYHYKDRNYRRSSVL